MNAGESTSLSLEQTELLLKKAYLKESEQDWDGAFRLYIECAQHFLQLSRDLANQSQKSRCRDTASMALNRAEKIKAHKCDVKPVAYSPYSAFNQNSVLENSANINGRHFPAWTSSSKILNLESQQSFEQPTLSPLQISLGASYGKPSSPWTFSHDLLPEELAQNSVTDCSLIASFAVCFNHDRRFLSKLLLSCVDYDNINRPGDHSYHFRFLINGTFRHPFDQAVDDTLPFVQGRLVCAQTLLGNSQEGTGPNLFPSLLEKAYMRLRGGYDFPGSNSGVDLHALIGWIPDCIHIRGGEFAREKTWTRLVHAFEKGTCLLTLGTDAKRPEKSDRNDEAYLLQRSLLEAHCYAVLGLSEEGDDQLVTFLDPWQDVNDQVTSVRKHICTWQIICEVFDTIHVSWDPGIWKHSQSVHRTWKAKDHSPKLGTNNHRISFSLGSPPPPNTSRNPNKDVLWVLLTRHIGRTLDTNRSSKFIALHVTEYHAVEENNRLREHDFKGPYSDDNQALLKLNPYSQDLSVIASLDGLPDENINYTLTIYSNDPITLDTRESQFLYSKRVEHSFTYQSSGGNFSSQTFMNNPQWHLKISSIDENIDEKAQLNLSLESERTMALNACIVWSRGERITDMVRGDMVASTGEYKYGVASCVSELKAGDYTLIVSPFTLGTLGSFLVQLNSSLPIELDPIAQEGAGMYRKVVKGDWKANLNAGGSPKFGIYATNPRVLVSVATQTQTRFRLRSTPSRAINVSIFKCSDGSEKKEDLAAGKEIMTSGAFLDTPCGVTTGLTTLNPGNYWAILSTYAVGTEASWELIIHHNKRDVQVQGFP